MGSHLFRDLLFAHTVKTTVLLYGFLQTVTCVCADWGRLCAKGSNIKAMWINLTFKFSVIYSFLFSVLPIFRTVGKVITLWLVRCFCFKIIESEDHLSLKGSFLWPSSWHALTSPSLLYRGLLREYWRRHAWKFSVSKSIFLCLQVSVLKTSKNCVRV